MNHFRIAAAALAAITLASCSDNIGGKEQDNSPVNIAIKLDLPGLSSGTRAIGAAVTDRTKATVTSGHLFIYDAATRLIDKHIYIGSSSPGYTVDGTVTISDITNVTVPDDKDEVVIKNVSASATNCMIVLNPPTTLFTKKMTSIDDVRKLAVTATDINEDATINCVTLTDDKALSTAFTTGFDGQGGATGSEQYTKFVELAATAIGTRIQLSKVTSEPTDDGNIIVTAFNVRGVYVNYYHTSIQLDGTTLSPATYVNNGSDEDVNYLSSPSAYAPDTAAEKLADLGPWAATSAGTGKASANPGGTNFWVYNLVPYNGVPHLLVNLDGIKFSTDGGTTIHELATDKWLTVKGYKDTEGEEVDAFVKSNIYTIGGDGLVFDYNDLTDDPESVRASISATVTVTEWKDNAVTPVL
jgi:hypothetical protein